ncbi:MAG: Uma2 family endonuclease [Pyrinomonadaceae bacterium]
MAQEIEVKTDERAAGAGSTPPKITYEEFLRQADEDVSAEWVDGEVHYISPASTKHQDLSDFLVAILRFFVEARDAGVVLSAPFQMKTGPELPGREPDLLFVAREHLNRLKQTRLEGPADLAVEIISPESRARDRGAKFYEYEQGGVREYWMLDHLRKQAEFYQLNAEGIYQVVAPVDGVYHSCVLEGLALRVEWLWQEPLPTLLSVLKEWKLV